MVIQECKDHVPKSGKCKIKVHTRYNDYCDPEDCPKKCKGKKINKKQS
jgi:hypothetical protein